MEDITENRAELLTAKKGFRTVVDQSNGPECDHTFIKSKQAVVVVSTLSAT